MRNVYNANYAASLDDQIQVTTAIDTAGVLEDTYPPNAAVFKSNVTPYLDPIIRFLVNSTTAPLFANIYPYFSYVENAPNIKLEYALLQPDSGINTPSRTHWDTNLFYGILDAIYSALGKRSYGRSLRVVASESGWPTGGGDAASVENARIYNTNLIRLAKDGTPKRSGEPIEVYIFAMLDENQKPGNEYERHFGIFTPNGQLKYPISFQYPSNAANRSQKALKSFCYM